MTLTLPIVVGKKYVRRDGVITRTSAPGEYYEKLSGGPFVCVAQCPENSESGQYHAFASNGRILPGSAGEHEQDLVADYIEPAKGHPHAALMAEFAKDAAECETPWERWEIMRQFHWDDQSYWETMRMTDAFWPNCEFRRKSTITPDPHAQSAAEYAKDMAETDKAWERREYQCPSQDGPNDWSSMCTHPHWGRGLVFRRKGSL